MTQERLQKFLSAAGVAARRKAEQMISAGRVTVNGQVVRVLGTKVDPEHDSVLVDGEAVAAKDPFYVLLNKPKGCITAVTDDRGRPTVMDYLPNLPVGVRPVGRLDFYSEGVLLLTNDGELAAKLLAPGSHVAKTYHVKIHGELSDDQLKLLRKGVRLEDGAMTLPAEINVLPAESKHMWLAITLREGKNRQIHRMIEALGYRIDKLQRVAFANLTFHGLRVGDARELTQQELNELLDVAGLPHGPSARGRWRAKRELTDIPRRARQKVRDEAELAQSGAAGAAPAPGDAPPPSRGDARDAGRNDRGGARGSARDDRGGARGSARDDRGGARGSARDDRGGARGSDSRDRGRPAARDARGDGRRAGGERPASRDDARRSFGKRTRKTETRRR